MITDQETGNKRPLTLNERLGAVVLITVAGCLAIGLVYALLTGAFNEAKFQTPVLPPTPVPTPRIQRISEEGIPFDTPIEFYTEEDRVKWREVIQAP